MSGLINDMIEALEQSCKTNTVNYLAFIKNKPL